MSEHELWNELGNLYFLSGAHEQAIQAYSKAIQMEDRFGKAYSNLAYVYAEQEKYEMAVPLFKKSLELLTDDKQKATNWSRLGNAYLRLKQYQESVFAYKCADELQTGMPRNNAPTLAVALDSITKTEELAGEGVEERQHDLDNVVEYLHDAELETEELNTVSAPAKAEMSLAAGQHTPDIPVQSANKEEEQLASKPISKDEEKFRPESVSGDERIIASEISEPEATPVVDEPVLPVQEADTPGEEIWPVQDFFQEDLVDQPDAINYLSTDEPGPVFPFNALGENQAQQKSNSRLESTGTEIRVEEEKLAKQIEINPLSATTWESLGTLYKTAGRYKEAIHAFKKAISITPGEVSYYHNLGLVYAAQGNSQEAFETFQKVLELDPNHSLTHASLGGYYKKMGLDDLAQKHIGKAMKQIYESENEYNRACLDAICGNIDQAIELLRIALENEQTYVDWVMSDPDLDTLREDDRFKQLIADFVK